MWGSQGQKLKALGHTTSAIREPAQFRIPAREQCLLQRVDPSVSIDVIEINPIDMPRGLSPRMVVDSISWAVPRGLSPRLALESIRWAVSTHVWSSEWEMSPTGSSIQISGPCWWCHLGTVMGPLEEIILTGEVRHLGQALRAVTSTHFLYSTSCVLMKQDPESLCSCHLQSFPPLGLSWCFITLTRSNTTPKHERN